MASGFVQCSGNRPDLQMGYYSAKIYTGLLSVDLISVC